MNATLVHRGKRLYKAIEDAVEDRGPKTVPTGWSTKMDVEVDMSNDAEMMLLLNLMTDDSETAQYLIRTHSTFDADKEFYYRTFYSTMFSGIIAASNYGRYLDQRVKDRWSDVVFPIWKNIIEAHEGEMHLLEYVVQLCVLNDDTNDVLYGIVPATEFLVHRDKYHWEYTPEDDRFYGKSLYI